jgi:patatin-like phospholipase/acyl hydrolase
MHAEKDMPAQAARRPSRIAPMTQVNCTGPAPPKVGTGLTCRATEVNATARGRAGSMRILALAGGGYLGLYTATVLAELEKRVGEPLGRRFDLVAGTSVGAIAALALAFEVPMQRVVRLFQGRGAQVFSPRARPRGTVTRLLDLSRSVLGPKYTGAALREVLTRDLGRHVLGEAMHNVVIPAVDVTRSQTKVFKTPHTEQSTGDEDLLAVDVAMAACAAPAYFPAVRIGDTLYADGGLFATAPDQVALHEAEHFFGVPPERVTMLSIGTAIEGYQPEDSVTEEDGAIGWLTDGRLILTLISVQQQHVEAMMEDRLGDRYLHLDARWPAEAGLGIDVATDEAAATLVALGKATVAGADFPRLARFM